jgi:phosphoserine phosphatase
LHGLTDEDTAITVDSANDIGVIQAASFSVTFTFKGEPTQRQQVHLKLNNTYLSGLLFLQGIRQVDFV